MLRFPCPKCREPIAIRAPKCPHCAYRAMSHERNKGQRLAELKMVTSCFIVGLVAFAVHYHR